MAFFDGPKEEGSCQKWLLSLLPEISIRLNKWILCIHLPSLSKRGDRDPSIQIIQINEILKKLCLHAWMLLQSNLNTKMLKLNCAHAFPAMFTISQSRFCINGFRFLVEGVLEHVTLRPADQLAVCKPQSLAFWTVTLQPHIHIYLKSNTKMNPLICCRAP